jgi:hypothetical protein
MGFDPYNYSLKIQESIETPTPKVGAHLGVWKFIPSHSPKFPGAWNVTLSFTIGHTFTSPCFGREPKAKVVTLIKQNNNYWTLSQKLDSFINLCHCHHNFNKLHPTQMNGKWQNIGWLLMHRQK